LWHEILGDKFMKRPRLSRIYYNNIFFNYPLKPMNALFGLGIFNTISIIISYFKSKMFPYKDEKTLEQWVSNRFGKKLFLIFFKTYTEKVWGIPCSKIGAEWAAQRIKGLSLMTAIKNALLPNNNGMIKTLIDQFNYPEYGPGMMYNEMANKIENMNNKIYKNSEVTRINHEDFIIKSVEINKNETVVADEFISSIPITDAVKRMNPGPDDKILTACDNLLYRDFILVGIIVNKKNLFPDNWIYVHSPEVKLGRIQNVKNWSPAMVADENKTTLGLEYFCYENDELWNIKDEELIQFAIEEAEKIGILNSADVEDGMVVRMKKCYPTYQIGYEKNLNIIKSYLNQFKNFQLVGRYGMYKYNNMDHSILTGLYAAKNIMGGNYNIWDINTEEQYHEESDEQI